MRALTIALAASRDWTRTLFLRGDDEDYTMSTRGRMLERLRVILAGRAAEQVRGSGVRLGCWGATARCLRKRPVFSVSVVNS